MLSNLIKIQNAKKGFEIGVFTGYTSLTMALALPEDGLIHAYDISEKFTDVAKKYWKLADVDKKIDLKLISAIDCLD